MADSIAVPIRRANRVLPLTLQSIQERFRVTSDGTVHSYSGSCWHVRDGGGISKYLFLSTLKAASTCEGCLRAYQFGGYMGKTASFLQNCVDAQALLTKVEKEKGGDMRRILTLRKKLSEALPQVTAGRGHAHADEVALVDKLTSDLRRADARLEMLLRSPEETQRVLAEVQVELVGDVDPEYVFAEAPTLVSIHPYQEKDWNRIVKALVQQCSLQRSPLALQVPRYVADYLGTLSGARRNGLQLTADASGATPEVLEMTLGLWNPEGTAALSSLAGALQAARVL